MEEPSSSSQLAGLAARCNTSSTSGQVAANPPPAKKSNIQIVRKVAVRTSPAAEPVLEIVFGTEPPRV